MAGATEGSQQERVIGEVPPLGTTPAPPVRRKMVPVWPDLLFRELLAALIVLVIFMVASLVFDAPLESPADPGRTPNPAKAPWYFVGLQEMLVYFDPWIAGVGIPLLITFGLCAIPYIDPSRRGQGVYTVRRRPFASAIFLIGLVAWFALIAIGMWFRGPGWSWVWPGQVATSADIGSTKWSLPNLVGVPLTLAFFLGGGALIVRRTASWEGFTRGRRWIFAFLVLAMAGTAIKIALRIFFGVQYVVSFERFGLNL